MTTKVIQYKFCSFFKYAKATTRKGRSTGSRRISFLSTELSVLFFGLAQAWH